ncbi:MAG: PIG-L family deacetylase [Lachnospiraceae bacterium]|nr:PIG-L family deacetylase [Lachnospiraceae bacterium]
MKKFWKFSKLILPLLILACMPGFTVRAEEAHSLNLNVSISNGAGSGNLLDGDYNTATKVASGDSITISSDEGIKGLYIAWNRVPNPWTLEAGGESLNCGENGFLHEYVELPSVSNEIKMNFTSDSSICYIKCYGEGELPRDVQVWRPADDKADILVFSAHSDDEILFMGGVLTTYTSEYDAEVQVAYMTEFWTTTPIREHEKLDGIWTCGVTRYPVCGDFTDVYCSNLEDARSKYSEDELTAFATRTIRRFKPQVTVTHDFAGEYGHGFHLITAESVKNALNLANDENYDADSASTYGIWDVPKAYFHLYEEGQVKLDLRHPVDAFGGQVALDVIKQAYLKHVSQQWCAFKVSDEYIPNPAHPLQGDYDCGLFGLYRTTVGPDTAGNDLMENLKTYAVQEEEERIAKEEEERIKAEEEAKKKAEEEAQKAVEEEEQKKEEEKKSASNIITIVLIVVLALVIFGAVAIVVMTSARRSRRRRRRRKR